MCLKKCTFSFSLCVYRISAHQVVVGRKRFISVVSCDFHMLCTSRLWLEPLLVMESLRGLLAVCSGLHAGSGLHHLPPPGLHGVCGDPGLPGRVHRSNAGHTAALLQLSEQIHRGHEVRIHHWKSSLVTSFVVPLGAFRMVTSILLTHFANLSQLNL